MTSYGLDEWFWAMFEPTWTWPNFTFGQLFMWIGTNNGQIWLPMGYISDSEQCSNRLELYLISLLVNFSCEMGQIMNRYDFPEGGLITFLYVLHTASWGWYWSTVKRWIYSIQLNYSKGNFQGQKGQV